MYDHHSARNMVQLIGFVAADPQDYKIDGEDVVRLVITVRDRDDDFHPFYTHHVVIAPKIVAKRCTRQGIGKYDELLVKGRLSNFKDKASGKVISNVQAHEVLSLRKHKPPVSKEKAEEEKETPPDPMTRYSEMWEDPKYQEGKASGKVVSLLEKRIIEEAMRGEFDDFDYEDEDEYNPPF